MQRNLVKKINFQKIKEKINNNNNNNNILKISKVILFKLSYLIPDLWSKK